MLDNRQITPQFVITVEKKKSRYVCDHDYKNIKAWNVGVSCI